MANGFAKLIIADEPWKEKVRRFTCGELTFSSVGVWSSRFWVLLPPAGRQAGFEGVGGRLIQIFI